jgi:predicted metal-dependent hydrolase
MTQRPSHRLDYGRNGIAYEVERRNRRTVEINVLPSGEVRVAAPMDAPMERIEEVVRRRAAWIARQQRYFSGFVERTPPRRYVSGETHVYLGRQYRLKVRTAIQAQVKLVRGFFLVDTHRPNDCEMTRELLEAWYSEKVQTKFQERIEEVARGFPEPQRARPTGLIIRRLQGRRGSMTPAGRLVLNRDLIKAPVPCIDYVICHELCHRFELHHAPAFWQLLSRQMPDWEERKKRLEQMV